MGYYTSHELEVVKGEKSLIELFRDEYDEANYALNEHGESYEPCKWYGHEKDMRSFSKDHPETLFKLSGEGEESGDIWAEYYINGKMQKCKAQIVIPEFNEGLLT